MKFICLIVPFLLIGAASAQLSADRERFDIELHPGEVIDKTLILTNIGDAPISEISKTAIGGNAKDFIFLEMPEDEILEPEDEAEILIIFAVPPETKPGSYTGFMYLIDNPPPSMPLPVEFFINVVEQASYGISLTINDAKSASISAKADESAELDLTARNIGQFRDVARIDVSYLPEGWSMRLVDGDDELILPYDLPLAPGASHEMKLMIDPAYPGEKGRVNITATSMGDKLKNSTVQALAEFSAAIRKYKAYLDLPEKVAINRTYHGSYNIELEVEERIEVAILTPSNLMIIPTTQVISVVPDKPGKANFTLLASKPGEYSLAFKAVDSNGMVLPEEIQMISAVSPQGVVVLTGDSLLYKTIASLGRVDNKTVPVILASSDGLSKKDIESLLSYSTVIILGNDSVVSEQAEKSLAGTSDVKRLQAESLFETSWRFASEMWKNGTAGVVICTSNDIDIFKAYKEAKALSLPLIICDFGLSEAVRSIVEEMTKRKNPLSKALVVGQVPEDVQKALEKMGLTIEGVAQ